MSIEFTTQAEAKRAAHLSEGHALGTATEEVHRGTRYLVSYCECGFEFVTRPRLREAGR